MSWLSKLQHVGVKGEYSTYLQSKILLTNRASMLLLAICVPYSVLLYLMVPQMFIVTIGCIILFSLILLLNTFHLHTLARFAFATSIAIVCFFLHIAFIKADDSLLSGMLAIQVSLLIVPWLTFDTREPYALGISTLISLYCLISVHTYNGWIDLDMDVSLLRSEWFELVYILTAGSIFLGGLYLLQSTNLTAEKGNQALINEMKAAQDQLKEKENSLNNYILEIEKSRQEDGKRQWAAEGLTKFTEILRSQSDLHLLATTVISQLVKYLNANQGGLFIINDEAENNVHLELLACYAWERQKFTRKQILKGEGLVGQSWLEKDSIFLTEVPNEYVQITSGLGKANPQSIIIIPLIINNEVFGVVELASFKVFEVYQQDFLKKVCETIAGFIATARVNAKTKLLLEQTQQQHEEMRSQEEEMRQNMEELSATQEEMQRKEYDYLNRIRELEGHMLNINQGSR